MVLRAGARMAAGARYGLAALIAVMLSGCGGYNFTGPAPGDSPSEVVSNLLAYGSLDNPDRPRGDKKDKKNGALVCPEVSVRDGTDAVRVYAGAQTGSNVRYEYALGDVARKCALAGRDVTLKIGVEGRVLLGPAGSAGTFNVPVRVAVIRLSTQEAAFSKLYTVPVNIPAGTNTAPFRFVADNLAVPFVSNKGNTDYSIEVGFDSVSGSKVAKPAGKRRRRGPAAAPADSG